MFPWGCFCPSIDFNLAQGAVLHYDVYCNLVEKEEQFISRVIHLVSETVELHKEILVCLSKHALIFKTVFLVTN